jgi:hypothetical protein
VRLEAEDQSDVRAVERRERLGLPLERLQPVWVCGPRRRHYVDLDIPPQPVVVGAIDLAPASQPIRPGM